MNRRIDFENSIMESASSSSQIGNLCGYRTGKCKRPKSIKVNGKPHMLCTYHRNKANANQRVYEKRKRYPGLDTRIEGRKRRHSAPCEWIESTLFSEKCDMLLRQSMELEDCGSRNDWDPMFKEFDQLQIPDVEYIPKMDIFPEYQANWTRHFDSKSMRTPPGMHNANFVRSNMSMPYISPSQLKIEPYRTYQIDMDLPYRPYTCVNMF